MTEFIQGHISIFNHVRTKNRIVKKILLSKRNDDYIFGRGRICRTRIRTKFGRSRSAMLWWLPTTSLSRSSPFLNCAGMTERAVPIHTAEGSTKIWKILNLEFWWSIIERYANRSNFLSSAAWPISTTSRQSQYFCLRQFGEMSG
jgi:hypothetical protein